MGDSRSSVSIPLVLPKAGDVLDGKYRLVRVVGEGGMGIVFEAIHLKLGQRVAIKVLQPAVASRADLLERFEREARAAGRLRGRNVARVNDVEVSPNKLPYMVMEFLEGNDLDAELERRGHGLPVEEAVDLLLQACRAIAEAHAAGIVHRDLKPSNLFLCVESGERVVKLLDFGISKMQDEASKLTSTLLVMGTIFYMSPEQVRSAKEVDGRTDIWALGVILYQLLAGVPPFQGSATSVAVSIVNDVPAPLSDTRADVPAGLEAAISKAMAKKADARFQDVNAFARAIAPYRNADARLSFEPPLAPPVRVQLPSSPGVTDPAMETARTIHELIHLPSASSDPGASRAAAVVPTTPGWETRETPQPRRGVGRVVIGGVALATVAAVIVFAASRAWSPSAPPTHDIAATSSPPASAAAASFAVPNAPSAASAEPSAAANPPPTADPSTSPSTSARPPTAPALVKTAGPRRPSAAPPAPVTTATPASPAKKDKPPLVAPF